MSNTSPYPETAPSAWAILRLCREAGHAGFFWYLCRELGLSKDLAAWGPGECRYMWHSLDRGEKLKQPPVRGGWLTGNPYRQ